MSPEVLSLLGGGLSGFIFKLIGSLTSAQQANIDNMIKKQQASEVSADKAALRGGKWIRRIIVCTILFGVIIAPFIVSFTSIGTTIPVEDGMLWWKRTVYTTVQGLLIHESVIQGLYCILGFYFGSSTIK